MASLPQDATDQEAHGQIMLLLRSFLCAWWDFAQLGNGRCSHTSQLRPCSAIFAGFQRSIRASSCLTLSFWAAFQTFRRQGGWQSRCGASPLVFGVLGWNFVCSHPGRLPLILFRRNRLNVLKLWLLRRQALG